MFLLIIQLFDHCIAICYTLSRSFVKLTEIGTNRERGVTLETAHFIFSRSAQKDGSFEI